jgi:hypothetical protein
MCDIWLHEFSREQKLFSFQKLTLQMASVVRSAGEMVNAVDEWRAAMAERG